jgi:hypothetical protein
MTQHCDEMCFCNGTLCFVITRTSNYNILRQKTIFHELLSGIPKFLLYFLEINKSFIYIDIDKLNF